MAESTPISRADLLSLLDSLHHGAVQHASAARVALTVWERAEQQGDGAGADAARALLRAALSDLIESLSQLERAGRRLVDSAGPAPTE